MDGRVKYAGILFFGKVSWTNEVYEAVRRDLSDFLVGRAAEPFDSPAGPGQYLRADPDVGGAVFRSAPGQRRKGDGGVFN